MTIAELNKFAKACVEGAKKSADPKRAEELAREALRRAAKRS